MIGFLFGSSFQCNLGVRSGFFGLDFEASVFLDVRTSLDIRLHSTAAGRGHITPLRTLILDS